MPKHGIDISAWQDSPDWTKIKNSGKANFVILKAGGSDAGFYKDSKFERNYAQAKAKGIPVGAYYYVGVNCTSEAAGIADAKRFIDIIKGKTFEYPVFIDVEATPVSKKKGATEATLAFCRTMQNAGYWVGIYGSTYSTFQSRLDDSKLQGFAHWVAQYGGPCEYSGKVGIGMWQYSRSGSVSGIKGGVDMNYAYVDYPSKIKAKGLNGFKKTASTTTNVNETVLRTRVVDLANSYVGCSRGDSKHKEIVDIFNTVKPDGWPMNYTAAWCATFVSAIVIKYFGKGTANSHFPLSANCAGIINGAKNKGIWVESDAYVPSPGDWIIYDWDDNGVGEDVTGYDHVGMVKSVSGGKITVIEGNRNNKCATRTINVNGRYIRGFVHPKFNQLAQSMSKTVTKKITVDGKWGKETTKALRVKLGLAEGNGVIKNQVASCKKYLIAIDASGWEFSSNPNSNSDTIEALQRTVAASVDGYIGEKTIKAMQRFLNIHTDAKLDVDGICGKLTVKALQTWINK